MFSSNLVGALSLSLGRLLPFLRFFFALPGLIDCLAPSVFFFCFASQASTSRCSLSLYFAASAFLALSSLASAAAAG